MAQKINDLAVKVSEYQDRQSGQMKGRYENVGAVIQSDDGSQFLMLKRTFNPAGVPNPDNRESVLVSVFEPRQRQQQAPQQTPQQASQQFQQPQQTTPQQYQQASSGGVDPDLDDQIPF